jgi:endonuclease YncB( thermonuclease family)
MRILCTKKDPLHFFVFFEERPQPSKKMGCCWSRSWKKVEYGDTKPFVLPVTQGKVVKVYDGDTITVAFYMNGTLYRTNVRLLGIDSPELKGSSEEEKKMAVAARDALSAKILNEVVELRNTSTEKYGRLLAEVWLDGTNLSVWMLLNNYAVPYGGGTKKAWGKQF